ncbi:hypothetical protein ACHWQZ_G009630 [Mnemiopsis leidyi]
MGVCSVQFPGDHLHICRGEVETVVRSKRKDSLIITPAPSHNFTYKASWLWNLFRNSESDLDFASTSCNSLKSKLNVSLLHAQNRYCSEWHNDNFTEFGPTTS